jgi:inosine-uridine nucleoside N-ribohydrolase
MTPDYFAGLTAIHNPLTGFVGRIAPYYLDYYRRHVTPAGVHAHDPCAVAFAIDPGLFRTGRMPVYVETEGRCAGQTVPDPRRQWIEGPEVEVCVDVDPDRLLALFKARLTAA